jgi:carboxyl-terminal processing protease
MKSGPRRAATRLLCTLLLSSTLCLPARAEEPEDSDAPAAAATEPAAAAEPGMAADAVLPLRELRLFAEIFNQIRTAYVEEVDDRELFENAIRGMLNGLDPHSAYLDKDSFADLRENTTGEFGGVGLEVGVDAGGFVRVITPMDDTPAQAAGIESGDLIIKLDGKSVKGMSLNEAVTLMRGPRGSKIQITIVREGSQGPLDLTLVRDVIKVRSVRQRLLAPGYGYLRIAQFQNETGRDLKRALDKLREANQGALEGLVLDLRNNPGGVLQASVEVADAFLDGGLIVYTEGRIENASSRYSATAEDLLGGAPIVALINGGTASASEIVAGALQDHRRAVIIGTESFGKGSVQTVLPLGDGRAVKLTTARYFTPNGRSIQAEGIHPDIVVERATVTPLASASQISEADLEGHLENGDRDEPKPAANATGVDPNTLRDQDYQLYEALNLLRGIRLARGSSGNN